MELIFNIELFLEPLMTSQAFVNHHSTEWRIIDSMSVVQTFTVALVWSYLLGCMCDFLHANGKLLWLYIYEIWCHGIRALESIRSYCHLHLSRLVTILPHACLFNHNAATSNQQYHNLLPGIKFLSRGFLFLGLNKVSSKPRPILNFYNGLCFGEH